MRNKYRTRAIDTCFFEQMHAWVSTSIYYSRFDSQTPYWKQTKRRTSTPGERVYRITQLAKSSFNRWVGSTHSWRILFYLERHEETCTQYPYIEVAEQCSTESSWRVTLEVDRFKCNVLGMIGCHTPKHSDFPFWCCKILYGTYISMRRGELLRQ